MLELVYLLCFSSSSIYIYFLVLFVILLSEFPVFSFLLSSYGYLDLYSYLMILLLIFSMIMILISTVVSVTNNLKFYYYLFMMLFFMVKISFLVKSILMFFFFFEVSLIPMMLIISGWGYQPERAQSFLYFFFYTMTGSLPLFFVLILMKFSYSLDMFLYDLSLSFNNYLNWVMYIIMIFVFMVKLPIYSFHLWLPKAHVEAPMGGSMILAGILLKLGCYGIIRFMDMMIYFISIYSSYLISFTLVGLVVVGYLTIRISDMKAIVAYSSISHMGLSFLGMLFMFNNSLSSALLMMLGHGFCSPGLFMMVSMLYNQSFSRSIYLNKGSNLMSMLLLYLFMFLIYNFSVPPSLGFFSEVLLIYSCLIISQYSLLFLFIGMFMVACFSVYFFSYLMSMKYYSLVWYQLKISSCEYLILSLHLIPLVSLFLFLGLGFM